MALPLFKLSDELENTFSSGLFSTSTIAQNSNYQVTNIIRSWTFDDNISSIMSANTSLALAATGGTPTQSASATLSSLSNAVLSTAYPVNIGKTYPSFITSGNNSGSGTTASVQIPAVVPGQVILLFLHKSAAATLSTSPSGFTSVGTALQVNGTADSGAVWYRVVDGSESYQIYSATWTTSASWNLAYAIYNGTNPSPINAVSNSSLAASSGAVLPSVTSTVGYTTAIYVSMPFLSGTTETTTFGGGVTSRFDYPSTTAGESIAIADKTNGTVGTASGTNTITTSDTAANLAWTIALAGPLASPIYYSESSYLNALSTITSNAINAGGGVTSIESWGFLSIN
jgi:hypothetical protein